MQDIYSKHGLKMYANDVCIIHTQKAVGSLYRIKYTVPTVFAITIEETPTNLSANLWGFSWVYTGSAF